MPDSHKSPASGTVTIPYSFISIASIILVIIVCVVRFFDWQLHICLKFSDYISMCSFGCVTIGLMYNAVSLQYNYQINKKKFDDEAEANRRDKIRFTYDLTSSWFKGDMAINAETTRRFLQPYKGVLNQSAKLIEFKEKLDSPNGETHRRSLISILNYFENLSLLLEDGVIDEDILKKCFKTLFLTYYNAIKEYIEDEQRGNNGGNSKIFINFVTLCKKWSQT